MGLFTASSILTIGCMIAYLASLRVAQEYIRKALASYILAIYIASHIARGFVDMEDFSSIQAKLQDLSAVYPARHMSTVLHILQELYDSRHPIMQDTAFFACKAFANIMRWTFEQAGRPIQDQNVMTVFKEAQGIRKDVEFDIVRVYAHVSRVLNEKVQENFFESAYDRPEYEFVG